MEIPNKPWEKLKSNTIFPNSIPIDVQDQLLRQKCIIGIRKPLNEKLYSQLLKQYIELISYNKNPSKKDSFLTKLKYNSSLDLIPNSHHDYSAEKNFISSLIQSFNNIEHLLPLIYSETSATSFDLLSRQLILSELKSQNISFKEVYESWVLNTSLDIEGELFSILAKALNCQIVEYTFLLDFNETTHGDSQDPELQIQFLRSSDKHYFLMQIKQMEALEFEFESNRINNLNST